MGRSPEFNILEKQGDFSEKKMLQICWPQMPKCYLTGELETLDVCWTLVRQQTGSTSIQQNKDLHTYIHSHWTIKHL